MRGSTAFVGLIYFIGWIAGIVLANGFWSTAAAMTTGGLWSWYLVVERVIRGVS